MQESCEVSRNGRKRILAGHPWVFASDIVKAPACESGEIVKIISPEGGHLGYGYFNALSQISLRVLSRDEVYPDREFFAQKVDSAIALRRALGVLDTSCRLIHAESDGIPAIIVDKFADVLVMQSLSAGADRLKEQIADILMEKLDVRGIYERSEAPVRQREGLQNRCGFLRGEFPTNVSVTENGIRLSVDVAEGQKTGYFLDQKENRAAIAPYVHGARVLDCFCHTGSFALHAAHYGAREVLGIDVSEEACQRARIQAELNGFTQCRFEAANAFDKLRALEETGEKFDCVILDPPAFAKNKAALRNALRGYKEINLRGMKLLKKGGFLVTCSCSQHVSLEAFLDMLRAAQNDAHCIARVLEVRSQGRDHAPLLAAPETCYLKAVYLQVE